MALVSRSRNLSVSLGNEAVQESEMTIAVSAVKSTYKMAPTWTPINGPMQEHRAASLEHAQAPRI